MTGPTISRRRLLRLGAAAGAGLGAPGLLAGRAGAESYRNEPAGATATVGVVLPLSGPDAGEGADALRGSELAVRHLNGAGDGGMIATFGSTALRGTGILGRTVALIAGDSGGQSDAARTTARRMIEAERAVMIAGGVGAAEATALQGLCQEAGVLYMAGPSHAAGLTGRDCRANGFRHFFNAEMSGAALAPALGRLPGGGRIACHLTADDAWGASQEAVLLRHTEALGWTTAATLRTPPGTDDFAPYLAAAAAAGADVLVLNHSGGALVALLTQTMQAGLRDRVVNGRDLAIVAPRASHLVATGAGEAAQGVLGTAAWHWWLQDDGSRAFVKSFGEAYGFPPGEAAHTCYCQLVLYADACERAGSFRPSEVGAALEDFAFDGLGNGPSLYRGADRQCFKDVLVVRGKASPTSGFDLLEPVAVAPRERIGYPPDRFGCRPGPYNDGA